MLEEKREKRGLSSKSKARMENLEEIKNVLLGKTSRLDQISDQVLIFKCFYVIII